MVAHGRRDGEAAGLRFGEQVHGIPFHPTAEREIIVGAVGKQLAQGARIDHRAGQAVLAEGTGLLEHPDLERAHRTAGLGISAGEPRQLDGTREAGGTGAHEHHVHVNAFLAGCLPDEEALERQVGLGGGRRERRVAHPPIRMRAPTARSQSWASPLASNSPIRPSPDGFIR